MPPVTVVPGAGSAVPKATTSLAAPLKTQPGFAEPMASSPRRSPAWTGIRVEKLFSALGVMLSVALSPTIRKVVPLVRRKTLSLSCWPGLLLAWWRQEVMTPALGYEQVALPGAI